MTEAEVRKIVAETVRETLTRFGIDADDPMEAQKDAAFVRRLRGSAETVQRQGLITAVIILTTGFLGLVWMTIKGHN